MKVYGEVSYSIPSDLLGGDMVGPVKHDGGVEVTVIKENGGILVMVRMEAIDLIAAANMVTQYADKAAKHVQLVDHVTPPAYRLSLFHCRALELHHGFASELAEGERS